MKYKIKESTVKYERGRYFIDISGTLYQIIYEEDRGYALLNVSEGVVESEFEETIEFLLRYSTLGDMKPVKQINVAEFEIVAE